MNEAKICHPDRQYPLTLVPLPMGEGTGGTVRPSRMRVSVVRRPHYAEAKA
jgi:hypothetical protein